MSTFTLTNGTLRGGGLDLLTDVDAKLELLPAAGITGAFLRLDAGEAHDRHDVSLGQPVALARFLGAYRYCPWWMKPAVGRDLTALPADTQYLYLQRTDGQHVLVLPLLDGWFRANLAGGPDGSLRAAADTGDQTTVGCAVTLAYIAVGADPYALMETAAREVMAHMHTGRLRRQKPVPPVVDLFGWCTWDAFYQEVSHEKVAAGLESFRAAGVQPRFLILDDGWQSVRTVSEDGKRRVVTALCANDKFPGDLQATVKLAREYGVQQFYVWHAVHGYWSGVDEESMHEYRSRLTAKVWSPEMIACNVKLRDDIPASMVPPECIDRFYNDYHRHLMLQGVDGVKVDSQCVLEACGEGHGGRVELMQAYHEALEGSVHTHFLGGLINCMSCSSDMVYSALNSNLTRSSDDFYPSRPETHGLHIWANAVNSLWMGEFVHPDWDMFQSGHACGAFHAAARAVSGGPVYVSDKPGTHDPEVLAALCFSDGTVPRCLDIGRPTADTLFADVANDTVLLKVFNRNPFGGVVAAFNIQSGSDGDSAPVIRGQVRPRDVHGLAGEQFAVYLHQDGALVLLDSADAALDLELGPLAWEIATIAPIRDGIAVIGLADKYNSGGAVTRFAASGARTWQVSLRDGGQILLFSRQEPKSVSANGKGALYDYDAENGALRIELPTGGPVDLTLTYAAS